MRPGDMGRTKREGGRKETKNKNVKGMLQKEPESAFFFHCRHTGEIAKCASKRLRRTSMVHFGTFQ